MIQQAVYDYYRKRYDRRFAGDGLALVVVDDTPRVCQHLDRDDVESAAGLGLAKAAREYNPARGPFKPFAQECIGNAVADAMRDLRSQRGQARRRGTKTPTAAARLGLARDACYRHLATDGPDVADREAPPAEGMADDLARLPDDLRQVGELRAAGWTLREIAAEVGLSHTGVRKRLARIQSILGGLWFPKAA